MLRSEEIGEISRVCVRARGACALGRDTSAPLAGDLGDLRIPETQAAQDSGRRG